MSTLQIGDVLKVQFPLQRPPGHEQSGTRPAVVVGLPDQVGPPRFPSLIVVPFTSVLGEYASAAPALYPLLQAGTGGLTVDSVALSDNVRALDVNRILSRLGTLNAEQYAPIREALQGMFRAADVEERT